MYEYEAKSVGVIRLYFGANDVTPVKVFPTCSDVGLKPRIFFYLSSKRGKNTTDYMRLSFIPVSRGSSFDEAH